MHTLEGVIMKIRLKDVPDLGLTYHLTRKSGELNDSLNDLIDDIGLLEGVEKTTTSVILATKLER